MAVNGEPLKRRHGVALWKAQSVYGTAVTPDTAMGIVNFDVTSDAGMQSIYAIGGADPLFLKPGNAATPFTISINNMQTSALLLQGQRSSGVLPWITIALGFVDDAGTGYAWVVQDCKIATMDVALQAGAALTGSLSGTGGLIAVSTALTAANLSPTPFWSYEAVLTKGGSAWESVGFRMTQSHSVTVDHIIPGVAPSSYKRGWRYQTEGDRVMTGELTRFAKSAIDLSASTISSFAMVLAMTDIIGGMTPNAISLTYSGVKFGSERLAMADDFRATTPFLSTGLVIA